MAFIACAPLLLATPAAALLANANDVDQIQRVGVSNVHPEYARPEHLRAAPAARSRRHAKAVIHMSAAGSREILLFAESEHVAKMVKSGKVPKSRHAKTHAKGTKIGIVVMMQLPTNPHSAHLLFPFVPPLRSLIDNHPCSDLHCSAAAENRGMPTNLVFTTLDYDTVDRTALEVALRRVLGDYAIADAASIAITFARGSVIATVGVTSQADSATITIDRAEIIRKVRRSPFPQRPHDGLPLAKQP